ncbi:MAG: GAF domain-containing sensor histidine kinase [Deltaproteobacteria bacterium]|nr:MAG: GAF domain-containing sensor histidine kinase [Deltaproteobacteria bacterium]
MHEEAERLRALYRYEVLDTPPEAVFDGVTDLASRITGCPVALITLVDEERLWYKSRFGLDAVETPRELGFCHYTIQRRARMVIEDARLDDRFADNPLVCGDPGFRFYAGASIHSPEGHRIGTVCVLDYRPRSLEDSELECLDLLAVQVERLFEMQRQLTVAQRWRALMSDAGLHAALFADSGALLSSNLAWAEAFPDGASWQDCGAHTPDHPQMWAGVIDGGTSAGWLQTPAGGTLQLQLYREPANRVVMAAGYDASEAAALHEAREAFVATISHELHTPLTAILGMADLLRATSLQDEQVELVDGLASAGAHLRDRLEDLLDYSRMSAGTLELRPRRFDLGGLLDELVDMHVAAAVQAGVDLRVRVEPGHATFVNADPGRVRQVLSNLVGNALKYAAGGRVTLVVEASPERVAIAVEDEGPGVDEADRERIFQPFRRGHSSMGTEGTGLGLHISRNLARRMGGDLVLDAASSGGARFTLVLAAAEAELVPLTPLTASMAGFGDVGDVREMLALQGVTFPDSGPVDAVLTTRATRAEAARLARERQVPLIEVLDAPEVPDASADLHLRRPLRPRRARRAVRQLLERGPRPGPTPRFEGLRALVVDDHPLAGRVTAGQLERLGFEVVRVASGPEGLAHVAEELHLVVADIRMPTMDGYVFARRWREREPRRRVPIIGISADARLGVRERCLAAGMDAYVVKPAQMEELEELLLAWYDPGDAAEPEDLDMEHLEGLFELAAISADKDLATDMIDAFVGEAPVLLAQAAALVDDGEGWQALAAMELHRLKGDAATLGLLRVSAGLEALRDAPESERATRVAELQCLVARGSDALQRIRAARSQSPAGG